MRNDFTDSCITFARIHRFDGISLDFEMGRGNIGIKYKKEFSKLLEVLYT